MSRNLKLDNRALTNSPLPIVDIRNVVLDTDKLVVNFATKIPSETIREAMLELNNVMGAMEIKAVLSFDSNLTNGISNRRISLSQDFNQKVDAREKIINGDNYKVQGNGGLFKMMSSDLVAYHEIPFSLTFDNMEEDIEHLSCLVFPYFVAGSKSKKAGKINSVLVFEQSRPVTESYICYTPDEKVWIGEVHKMPSGKLMTGRSHTPQDVALRHEKVSNSKFHNYRTLHEIVGTLETISPETEILRELTEFSNIYLSPDRDGNVRFLFGVDCRSVFDNNAKNKLLIDYDEKRIEEIRIYRYRSDTLGEERKLIVHSEDQAAGTLAPADHREKETLLASIRETNLQNSSNDTRYFTVTDFETKDSGIWNYAVEIDFEENTEKEINNTIQRLNSLINELKTYIEDASLSGNSSSGRFNQAYAESNIEIKTRLLRRCIRSYIKGLSLFFAAYNYDELARNLTNITFPKSGNLEGLLFFQELIHDLVYKLEDTIRKDNFLSKKKTSFESSVAHVRERKNTFTISRDYSNIEESYVVKDFKDIQLDLLYNKDAQPENLIGLPIVSKQQWTQGMGDLVPAFVRLKGKELDLQDAPDQLVFNNFVFLKEEKEEASDSVLDNPLSQMLTLLGGKSATLLANRKIQEIKSQKMALSETSKDRSPTKYIDADRPLTTDKTLFNRSENERTPTLDKIGTTLGFLEKERINSSLVLSQALDSNPSGAGVSYRAEVLAGTGMSVVDEDWQPLTGDILENISGASLIRLRANVLDFPLVNEYFIIGSPQIRRTMRNAVSVQQPKNTDIYSEFLNFSVSLLEAGAVRRRRRYKKTSSSTTPIPASVVAPAPSATVSAAPVSAAPRMSTPTSRGGSGY